MPQNAGEVRFAAQSLYQNAPCNYNTGYRPLPRSQSQNAAINSYDDAFAGLSEMGRMSDVRRFFCLFVTFDLFFIALLWLICAVINGADIFDAMDAQIRHYNVHHSLFDVVMAAIFRFTLLILFYAILSIKHWFVIALSTTTTCSFLIYKVFVYSWVDSKEPVFQVLLIVISFVLAWGETWFLDCRVIPQERYARRYASYFLDPAPPSDVRTPLVVAPFLQELPEPATSTFYSPFETVHNSDDEDDAEQDAEWLRMGAECVERSVRLLESSEWLVDRVTDMDDTIRHITLPKMGKVWRVTARVNFPARLLLEHLFYRIEDIHTWNTTILESKILHTISPNADITYQVTAGAGIVKSRDFVNLRCWSLCRDGKIVKQAKRGDGGDEAGDDTDAATGPPSAAWPSSFSQQTPVSVHSLHASTTATTTTTVTVHRDGSNGEGDGYQQLLQQQQSVVVSNVDSQQQSQRSGLNQSLGASGFFDAPDDVQSGDDELDEFADAKTGIDSPSELPASLVSNRISTAAAAAAASVGSTGTGNLYVSAAISVPYDKLPPLPKYTRAENRLSCWAMREIEGKPAECIFEWLMCVDLKGYVPTSIINKVYPTIIQDYMVSLRKHCEDLKSEHRQQKRQTSSRLQS